MASKFEYPRLSRRDIVTILAESQIATVTDQDLFNPIPDFVADLYTRLLIYLDCLSEEDQGQLDFDALQHLENPEFHSDSTRIMNLFNRIKSVLAAVNCPKKFTLKDLIKPDADRTEHFLSAILNFCLHKDTKMNLLRPLVEELSILDEQRKEFEAMIDQLNGEIAYCNEAREMEFPLFQEVDAQVKELRQTIAALNNQQMSLRASYRKMKERTTEMDDKIRSAEFALVESVQENANLRSKIVQSPDKLQRALEDKKSAREEAQNAERSAMQFFQEKTTTLELYSKVLEKMSKHYAQMEGIQEQVNSSKNIEKDFKGLKVKLSDEEVMDKSLEAKLVERQGKAQHLDEVRKQLERERDIKCDEATKEFHNVKMVVESQRRDLEARQRNVEDMVAEVDALTSQTNSVKELGAAKVQKLVDKCEEIVKEFHLYLESVGAVLPKTEVQPKFA